MRSSRSIFSSLSPSFSASATAAAHSFSVANSVFIDESAVASSTSNRSLTAPRIVPFGFEATPRSKSPKIDPQESPPASS